MDCVLTLARAELAAVDLGLRLWRQWIDLGAGLVQDLNRGGLAQAPSFLAPTDRPSGPAALEAALSRFLGQLSQLPFQVAMQLLVEARGFLAEQRPRGALSPDEIRTAIDTLRLASNRLTRKLQAAHPAERGGQTSERTERGLEDIAATLDETRLLLQRLHEALGEKRAAAGPPMLRGERGPAA